MKPNTIDLTAFAVDKSDVIVIGFCRRTLSLPPMSPTPSRTNIWCVSAPPSRIKARTAVDWLSGEIQSIKRGLPPPRPGRGVPRPIPISWSDERYPVGAAKTGDFNAQVAAAHRAKGRCRSQVQDHPGNAQVRTTESDPLMFSIPVVRRLSEQRVTLLAQLAEQSTSLGDRHPRIKGRAQIADLDQQIRLEAARTARAFENDAKIANARLDALTTNFDQLQNRRSQTPTSAMWNCGRSMSTPRRSAIC